MTTGNNHQIQGQEISTKIENRDVRTYIEGRTRGPALALGLPFPFTISSQIDTGSEE